MKRAHSLPGKKGLLGISMILVLLIVGILVAYAHFNRTPDSVRTTSEYTKGEHPQNSDSSEQNDPKASSGATTPPAKLEEPTGNFVSSHHPKLTSREASTCNTTPGAKCTISFTKASTTKSLPTQTTDEGGATYWSWQPTDIGLTTGTWKIKVSASYGALTETTTDALSLVISE